MSLDVYLSKIQLTKIYSNNITHNLGKMADAAGIYKALWRPEELFTEPRASDIIPLLATGLKKLKEDPEYYMQFNPSNGWGTYEYLVEFVQKYLAACNEDPDAFVNVSR